MKSTSKFYLLKKSIHKTNNNQKIINLKDCEKTPKNYDNKQLNASAYKFKRFFNK